MFEGKCLIVYLVCEKGLTADWNAAHPERLGAKTTRHRVGGEKWRESDVHHGHL